MEETPTTDWEGRLNDTAHIYVQYPHFEKLIRNDQWKEADEWVRSEILQRVKSIKPKIMNAIRSLSNDIRQSDAISRFSQAELHLDALIHRYENLLDVDKKWFHRAGAKQVDKESFLQYLVQTLSLALYLSKGDALVGVETSVESVEASVKREKEHPSFVTMEVSLETIEKHLEVLTNLIEQRSSMI